MEVLENLQKHKKAPDKQVTLKEAEQVLKQAVNMALNKDGESSYTLSFDVKATEEECYFIFYVPSALVLNQELYNRLTAIFATNIYPFFTVFPQPAPRLVSWDTNDIHKARAWAFPWKRGTSSRLVISDMNSFLTKYGKDGDIWLMPNYKINVNEITSIALMGLSGSGKTVFTKYLNSWFAYYGDVVIVDPKASKDLVWWGRNHNQKVIYPTSETSKSDFLSRVNDTLSDALRLVYQRQEELLEDPTKKFRPVFYTIDELGALTVGVNKTIKNSFFSLLQSLILLSRETNLHLLLVSQQLDNTVIPTAVRSQTNVRVLLKDVNARSAQFLFPDIDVNSIVLPTGVATGIIQTINGETSAVTPFLAPTVKGGV